MSLLQQLLANNEVELYIDFRSGTFKDWAGKHPLTKVNSNLLNREGCKSEVNSEFTTPGIVIGTSDYTHLVSLFNYQDSSPSQFKTLGASSERLTFGYDGDLRTKINNSEFTGSGFNYSLNKKIICGTVADRDGMLDFYQDGILFDSKDISAQSSHSIISIPRVFPTYGNIRNLYYQILIKRALTPAEVAQLTAELENMQWPAKVRGTDLGIRKLRGIKANGYGARMTWPKTVADALIPPSTGREEFWIDFMLGEDLLPESASMSYGDLIAIGPPGTALPFILYHSSTNLRSLTLLLRTGVSGNIFAVVSLPVDSRFVKGKTYRVQFIGNSEGGNATVNLYVNGKLTSTDTTSQPIDRLYNGDYPTNLVTLLGRNGASVSESRQGLVYVAMGTGNTTLFEIDFNQSQQDSVSGVAGTFVDGLRWQDFMVPVAENPIYHKSDWGITANESDTTSGPLENTPYEVLTGTFKVRMSSYGKAPIGGNIMVDGDMEESGTGSWFSDSGAVLSKVASSQGGGTQALRVSLVAPDTLGSAKQLTAVPGKVYRVRGWYKTDGVNGLFVRVGLDMLSDTTTLPTDWTYFEYMAYPTTTEILLGAWDPGGAGGGYVEYDNVVIEELPLNVKVIECVGDGTIQLPTQNEDGVWTVVYDEGEGYAEEVDTSRISSSDVLTMATGDKLILADIRGEYALRYAAE